MSTGGNRPPVCERHSEQFGPAVTIVDSDRCPLCWVEERAATLVKEAESDSA